MGSELTPQERRDIYFGTGPVVRDNPEPGILAEVEVQASRSTNFPWLPVLALAGLGIYLLMSRR